MANGERGLTKRGVYWSIDKVIPGYGRLCESTKELTLSGARRYLAMRIAEIREQRVYKNAPLKKFRQAAAHHLKLVSDRPSYWDDKRHLEQLGHYIGHLPLDRIDRSSLSTFITDRQAGTAPGGNGKPVSVRTVNIAIELVIRILRAAHDEWIDESGKRWLVAPPPRIRKLRGERKDAGRPVTRSEEHLVQVGLTIARLGQAILLTNTGLREQMVILLRWEYERHSEVLGVSIFVIPAKFGGRRPNSGVKNEEPHTVVLNSLARAVIEVQRRKRIDGNPWVFTNPHTGLPYGRLNDRNWRSARAGASRVAQEQLAFLPHVRVHDLKHTFGARLLAEDIPLEAHQILLGHKPLTMTGHYSHAALKELLAWAERVVRPGDVERYMERVVLDDWDAALREDFLQQQDVRP